MANTKIMIWIILKSSPVAWSFEEMNDVNAAKLNAIRFSLHSISFENRKKKSIEFYVNATTCKLLLI